MMIRRSIVGALAVALTTAITSSPAMRAQTNGAWVDTYREPARRIIAEELATDIAWRRLADLTDTIGNRLSGTPQLARAIDWAVARLTADGFDNVHTEAVPVPRWVRGAESAAIVSPADQPIVMLGLGNSVGTPPSGIEAEVIVAHSFEELDQLAARVRGRIVLFNVPFTNYNDTVRYRRDGATRAARHGAVAVLVRSIGPPGNRLPHTGSLDYGSDAPKIPAAAVTTEDADELQRLAERGRVVVRLKMEAHFDPDAQSANVVAELRGRELPDEVVVLGGHLDSWDVGAGASDDGVGCVMTWEALRLLKALNLRPRRTLRVVFWTNEENGARGGLGYRDQHRDELPQHVAMIESDIGAFHPSGFGFTGSDTARTTVRNIASLLADLGADRIVAGGGGADIDPAAREGRVPELSLESDQARYFVIHHTPADTVDKIDPHEVSRGAAAVTVMAYVLADLPTRLK